MPRKSTLFSGLASILAGVLLFSQPALPSTAQTASPLQSPSASPTPAYTPPPTFTPQPTFTPLPPMTPTPIPPIVAPVSAPLPPIIDPILIVGGGLFGLIIILIIWSRLRRSRQAATAVERAAQPTEPVKPIAPPPAPTAALEFEDTAGSIVRFPLTTPSVTLGRSTDNDLIVPDVVPGADTVSQHHAQFRRDQDDYIVRDLNSQNGLTVNGRHTNHNVLQDNDRIAFGAAEAVYHKPSGGAA
ncbi:MAG: FHA domain-containing protein [Chloroflexi bacterium]|nr:FHA domain-containing protein [Chloroflexota bacterium]